MIIEGYIIVDTHQRERLAVPKNQIAVTQLLLDQYMHENPSVALLPEKGPEGDLMVSP